MVTQTTFEQIQNMKDGFSVNEQIEKKREADFIALIIKAYIYMLQTKEESAQINFTTTFLNGMEYNQSYIVYLKDFDELSQKIKDRIMDRVNDER